MTLNTSPYIEPFVKRGLFNSSEQAIATLARSYILQQIEKYRTTIAHLEAKYGMTYQQFDVYLKARAQALQDNPTPELGQAVMLEEDIAFDWKVADEMLSSWLGLQTEAGL
jgi:hypothetical protein